MNVIMSVIGLILLLVSLALTVLRPASWPSTRISRSSSRVQVVSAALLMVWLMSWVLRHLA